jgi:predicted nucleic acid-binding protein
MIISMESKNNDRYIIDSNLFYAFFVADDTLHVDAVALFESID